MQVKTNSVAAASASVGLNIHKGKSKILKYNMEITNPITFVGETLEDVKSSTYLGSIIDEQRRSDVWAAFIQLKNIWDSKQQPANQHQRWHLQYERQHSSTVRSLNLENYHNHHQNCTGIYKQLST
ncbi:unnamed protein product [Schistosoma mattheei]|uniref:Uncharacterized protein n=1 Tax=Schistosoma mattheei TaxID=31246 RepID=A0A183P831_9TREM|nr:unnamed protein product [Schistosoma mattheei]